MHPGPRGEPAQRKAYVEPGDASAKGGFRLRGSVLALVLSLLVAVPFVSLGVPAQGALPAPQQAPRFATVALIDTGVNPYHAAFLDPSPLALQHPSTYIPGYPADAIALELCIPTRLNPLPEECQTFRGALAHDKAVWEFVNRTAGPDVLFWFPGTKIVGAIRMGGGGTNCPLVAAPPGGIITNPLRPDPFLCRDWPLLDNHGHGTMTATRAAANEHSLCPTCRIVEIEGLGGDGVRWAADQPWIDVQSNSWLSLVPPPANQVSCTFNPPACGFNERSTAASFSYAEERMLTLAASGNGAAYIMGFAPTPTYILSTAAPGVILVGAHDNGRVAAWSGAPAHVAADGYAGWRASNTDLTELLPHPMSCCTSSSSPYAAGGAARVVTLARQILDSTNSAARDGVLARAPAGHPLPPSGPLRDGLFTLAEAKEVYLKTAQARPQEGRDDGLVHWAADPTSPSRDFVPIYGPGANPFCQGCWTLPVKWADVPAGNPGLASIGYGGINEFSVALAEQVLLGNEPLPERALEDAFFAADGVVRGPFFVGT